MNNAYMSLDLRNDLMDLLDQLYIDGSDEVRRRRRRYCPPSKRIHQVIVCVHFRFGYRANEMGENERTCCEVVKNL